MAERVELQIGGKTFFIESGLLAKQAAGSVVVGFEETIILAAVSAEDSPREGLGDFLPLTVDYRDRIAAAGRIPGGFFKRETRPADRETLISRLVDRSLRPMFADGYQNETQIIIHPLSFDYEHDTDAMAITSASAALMISHLPFFNPISGVRVGRVNGEFVVNPTLKQTAESDMNIIVSGTEESLCMVEGGGAEMSEEDLVAALEFGHEWVKKICAIQKELAAKLGKQKITVTPKDKSADVNLMKEKVWDRLKSAVLTKGKAERSAAMKSLRKAVIGEIMAGAADAVREGALKDAFDTVQKNFVRHMIVTEGLRADSRNLTTIRDIEAAVDALPRTHGSALFTRGETQALVTTTLGTGQDELMQERLEGKVTRRFMLHYNFPPFCVGEVKRMTGPGRREIGHGALAERALEPVIPTQEAFPYTIRVVSEVLESNGSSSMATVCGASLSLMDAGVPIKAAVAGVAMGLVQEGDKIAILSDILGLEDALGDMDFKVAGTSKGITAVQMDIKLEGGLTVDILTRALAQAKEGRLHVLGKMDEALSTHREDINKNAPRIHTIKINPAKVGALIGPGGKVIRGIVADTGCQIDIEDDGTVLVASANKEQMQEAVRIITSITQEAEVGKVYVGTVKRVVDFGAFIEIFPGCEGLCHISEMAKERVNRVEDVMSEGDEVIVKCIGMEPSTGKIRLSRKEAMSGSEGGGEERPRREGGDRDRRPGGREPRFGGRGDRDNRR